MKTKVALSLLLLLTAASLQAKEYTYLIKPVPKGLQTCRFELWVPETISAEDKVRAVLCSVDYQAGTNLYEDEGWRDLAAKLKCVQLRYDMAVKREGRTHRLPTEKFATDLIKDALSHFAKEIKHPELKHSAMLLTGLSQSAGQCLRFAMHMPDRVIGAVPFHTSNRNTNVDKSSIWSIPFLFPLGEKDMLTLTAYRNILEAREHNALWAALIQPEIPHHQLGNQDVILMWVEEIIEQRVPMQIPAGGPVKLKPIEEESGWLGVLNTRAGLVAHGSNVYAYGKQPNNVNPERGHWLPSKKVAKAWAKYCLAGSVDKHEEREEIAAKAIRAKKPVIVDSKLDEWGKLPFELKWPAQVLPHGLNWHGSEDSSATFGIQYDDQYLYMAFDVTDDQNVHEDRAPWFQDGLEVRINAKPAVERATNRGRGENSTFLLLAFSPVANSEKTHIANEDLLPDGVKIAAKSTTKGYRAELAIPVSYLDEMQGQSWKRFRLNITIDDKDDSGTSQVWYRPDWRSDDTYYGSGTVDKQI